MEPILLQQPGSNQKILITDTVRAENIDAAELLNSLKPLYWQHLGIETQWHVSKWSAVLSDVRDRGGIIVEARLYLENHDPAQWGHIVGVCVGDPTGYPGEMTMMVNEAAYGSEELLPAMRKAVAAAGAALPKPLYFGHAEIKRIWIHETA